MPRTIYVLSWDDFEMAVLWIAKQVGRRVTEIYGEPRGGLPLAVALSHVMKLPWTDRPSRTALWVDDIVDSGKTLAAVADRFEVKAAWVIRGDHPVIAPIKLNDDRRVLFPWEVEEYADQDAAQHEQGNA